MFDFCNSFFSNKLNFTISKLFKCRQINSTLFFFTLYKYFRYFICPQGNEEISFNKR